MSSSRVHDNSHVLKLPIAIQGIGRDFTKCQMRFEHARIKLADFRIVCSFVDVHGVHVSYFSLAYSWICRRYFVLWSLSIMGIDLDFLFLRLLKQIHWLQPSTYYMRCITLENTDGIWWIRYGSTLRYLWVSWSYLVLGSIRIYHNSIIWYPVIPVWYFGYL